VVCFNLLSWNYPGLSDRNHKNIIQNSQWPGTVLHRVGVPPELPLHQPARSVGKSVLTKNRRKMDS
jgi:hypothetical protein